MHNSYKIIPSLAVALLVTGCSVESKTWINENRVEIHDEQFTDTFETYKMNDAMLHAIGVHYYRYGNGDMNVVVSYDPQSKINTQNRAKASLDYIQSGLSRNGVSHINSALSPARGSGDISSTLISFPALTAKGPSGCGMMPGYNSPAEDIPNDVSEDPSYRYGCTVENLLAKQVSRPSDLLGKQGFEGNADGRRQERVLSTRGYYGDKPNAALDGEKASEN